MPIAIVTGGNKGIGLEITKELLKQNYQVIVGGRTEYLDEETSKKVNFIKTDLTKLESHEKLAKKAIENHGKLDLYVNNVGISEWKPINEINEEFLNKLIHTNIYSTLWGCKVATNYLGENGSIINISSIAGKEVSTNNSVYVATKFAMNGITQSLAKELGSKKIRVNAICPVLIKTEGLMTHLNQSTRPQNMALVNFSRNS